MRILLALLLSLAAFAANADAFRFDRGVVVTGDSAGILIQKAGRQPDRQVRLENSHGGAIGERWEFYFRDKQVNFYLHDGRVTRIEEIR